MVYENYKVYGPYLNKKDNRLRCNLVFKNKMKIISYPKYLIEVYLDRYLDKDETVDHIDRNRHNSGYFCSKQCTGKYGALIQNGEIKKEYEQKIIPDKYRVRSAPEEIRDVEVG